MACVTTGVLALFHCKSKSAGLVLPLLERYAFTTVSQTFQVSFSAESLLHFCGRIIFKVYSNLLCLSGVFLQAGWGPPSTLKCRRASSPSKMPSWVTPSGYVHTHRGPLQSPEVRTRSNGTIFKFYNYDFRDLKTMNTQNCVCGNLWAAIFMGTAVKILIFLAR